MPAAALKQTTLRIDPEVLRKARFYLDTEHKSVNEFIVEQLMAYIAQHEQGSLRHARPPREPVAP